ncbi:MAG: hypothetical protein CM1200mP20_12140 [Pseudomonadota bacterium]|nr:MAG: hypothetical protein CM1200mP20_12140 [Pseudomonadota bacterium]
MNIYPAEIESVLLGFPGYGTVRFGIPDEEYGEAISRWSSRWPAADAPSHTESPLKEILPTKDSPEIEFRKTSTRGQREDLQTQAAGRIWKDAGRKI